MDEVAPILDFDDTNHDPFAIDELAFGEVEDLHERIASMRSQGEVLLGDPQTLFGGPQRNLHSDRMIFTVIGYDEVKEVAGDPERFSQECQAQMLGLSFGRTLSVLDPPEHPKVRKVFQKVFLPRTISDWGEKIIRPTINDLIDGFIGRGQVNFMEDFAKKYPFEIIFRQLALPERDIHTFHKLATSLIQMNGHLLAYSTEASRKLGNYFKELIAARLAKPGEDLISMLANAEADGDRIPEDILISFFRQLLAAGADTTYRSTGAMIIGLVQNPDQLADVRADRALVPTTVDEALRWNGPNTFSPRTVTGDTKVGGVHMPAGSIVFFSEAGGNRDPRVFERPEEFDVHRPRHRNLAFSYGPHVCLGQHLARMEMELALNAILDRLDNLRLNPEMPQPRFTGITFRTPKDVHLLFDPVQ